MNKKDAIVLQKAEDEIREEEEATPKEQITRIMQTNPT